MKACLRETGLSIDRSVEDKPRGLLSSFTIRKERSIGYTIKFKNILWIEKVKSAIENTYEVSYLREVGDSLRVVTGTYTIVAEGVSDISQQVMRQSYINSKPSRTIMVIINPHSGKHNANAIYRTAAEPILQAAHCNLTVKRTERAGDAMEIARHIDINQFDMILCVSGDGIPHEVINGIWERKDRVKAFDKLIITQVPSGSGNALSLSCLDTTDPSHATLESLKAPSIRCDLMAVYDQRGQTTISFLSQTFGAITQADVDTTFMRLLGQQRFLPGVAYQVFMKCKYPCQVAVKYKVKTKSELYSYYQSHVHDTTDLSALTEKDLTLDYKEQFIRSGADLSDISNLKGWDLMDKAQCLNTGIFYTGKMPYISGNTDFFPAALPDDGSIDVVATDVRSGIRSNVHTLLSLDKGEHVWNDNVLHFKVEALRVIPKKSTMKHNCVSIDGENVPLVPFQVEVLNRAMKTVMTGGHYKESGFLQRIAVAAKSTKQ